MNDNTKLLVAMVLSCVIGVAGASHYYKDTIERQRKMLVAEGKTTINLVEEYHSQNMFISNKRITLDTSNYTKYFISTTIFQNQEITNPAYYSSTVFKNCSIIHTAYSPTELDGSLIVVASLFENCTIYGFFDNTNLLVNCTEQRRIKQ